MTRHASIPEVCCIFCKKQTNSLGLAAHIRIVHNADKSLQLLGNAARRGMPAWNSGKTKETDNRINDMGKKISLSLTGKKGHAVSEATKLKISNTAKLNKKSGGYRPGSGIGKSGWYDNIWCDSTWELAFVIWCKNAGKHIIRNKKRFSYVYEGVSHHYTRDFVVDGVLYEIKGRRVIDDLIQKKLDSVDEKIIILLSDDMNPILNSVHHLQPLEQLYVRRNKPSWPSGSRLENERS